MNTNTNTKAFFELVRAGLWENEVRLSNYKNIDFAEVYRLAEEQSVIGMVAAGIDHVVDVKVPQVWALQFAGQTIQLEQRNKAMNAYIAGLIDKLRKENVYALLVKGQGVAQCYEKPMWRCSGDIDLFLSDENFQRAKSYLLPLASSVEEEYVREKHLGLTILETSGTSDKGRADGWVVELHGHLYSGLSSRVERELDKLQEDSFYGDQVRSWMNGQTQIFLLKAENDAFYVFTHILQHFYKGGIGLRQICDWSRLLYTYRDSMNRDLLEQRIKRAGLMMEWKAFGALAIEYLGFPKDSMPLLDVRSKKEDVRWRKKADRIMEFILKSGNMGHNRDMSHFCKYPYLIRKCVSMGRRISDLINHARIFPLDSLRFFPYIMFNGVRSAIRGE